MGCTWPCRDPRMRSSRRPRVIRSSRLPATSRASRTSSSAITMRTARARRRPIMWLRSVFLKTLRDYRIPILGWGIGMGLVVVSPMASVATLLSTPQAREQLVGLAATFAWNADVVAVDTIGGYATFKIGMFTFLVSVWPMLAASRMLRRAVDHGHLDLPLSGTRTRVVGGLEKLAPMW